MEKENGLPGLTLTILWRKTAFPTFILSMPYEVTLQVL